MGYSLYDFQEAAGIRKILVLLQTHNQQAYQTCLRMEEDLRSLSEVFSRYPSIIGGSDTGRSLDTLIDALYQDGCDHTVLLPTKVVVGRSFMIAKFNFFGYLLKLSRQGLPVGMHIDELRKYRELIVFSLLLEDVYQVIIERDGCCDPAVRRQAAVDLINLWEYRFDRTVSQYAPVVVDLWRVRKRLAPVFGTMMGTIELMKLSSLLSDLWHQFLCEISDQLEIVQALEEFIFGLTYEQITKVRSIMSRRHIAVVNRDELKTLLSDPSNLHEQDADDPREMYRFYQYRTKNLTRRIYAQKTGPKRTLEEILLAYLIEKRQISEAVT